MTSTIEKDIESIPQILRQTSARVAEEGAGLRSLLRDSAAFLGCGSSHCIALAAATLYETTRGAPGQAIAGSEYRARPGWNHLVVSRTGQTSELVEALRKARAAGARIGLIRGDPDSPAEALADEVLPLEFASEQGVVQTRFILAALYALRLLIGDEQTARTLADLPERVQRGMQRFEPEPLARYQHIVFLGRSWRYGLARLAALNLQETALLAPESHQTLEYRHGPIAAANERTLVWCFDPPTEELSAAVIRDVYATGASVYRSDDDPLVQLAQEYCFAVQHAKQRGLDPDAPRHLTRAIVLPQGGGQHA